MTGRPHRTYNPSNAVVERRLGTPVSAVLLPKDYQALDELARERNVPRTVLVREAICEYIERRQWLAPGKADTT